MTAADSAAARSQAQPPAVNGDGATDTGETGVPSYEAARDELAQVVRALETGGVTLEESLVLWERGEALARICEQWLEGARSRLNAIVDGDPDD
jgi:exodeoxyribonuclease VII small subunit